MDEALAQASKVHATPAVLGIIECRAAASKDVLDSTVTRRLTVRRVFKIGDVVGPCYDKDKLEGKIPRTMVHVAPIDIFRSLERTVE